MPKQREASPEEIVALTTQFRALWRKGDALRPWMRQHRQMVLDLVHGDYSWDAIAKALSKAKIKYQGGQADDWTAEGLRREFVRAARPRKFDKNPANVTDLRAEVPLLSGPTEPRSAVFISTPETPALLVSTMPAEPRFKPVSFRPPQPRRDPTSEELAQIEEARRLTFGRS